MYSGIVRIQNTFGFFTTVVSVVAAFIALSSFFFPQSPSAELIMRDVRVAKGRAHYYSTRREEYAHVKFTLDMDLSSLYNWNTKQVFVYITASYPSNKPSEPPTKSIIWDAILPSKLAPYHQNQYIHPGPDPKSKRRPSKYTRIYSDSDVPGKMKLKGKNQNTSSLIPQVPLLGARTLRWSWAGMCSLGLACRHGEFQGRWDCGMLWMEERLRPLHSLTRVLRLRSWIL